jgi:hypothetical protein
MPTYSFIQIIDWLQKADTTTLMIIADLVRDEAHEYSPFHLEIISYTISMQRRMIESREIQAE